MNLFHPRVCLENDFLRDVILGLEIMPGLQETIRIIKFPAIYAELVSQVAASNQDPAPEDNLRNRI
jgi:hypothetical protein